MILVIDCNSICHQYKNALKRVELSYEEKDTAIIFGFLKQVLFISQKFNPTNWVFTWDSKKSHRKSIYPDYKRKMYSTRTPEEEAYDHSANMQFSELRTTIIPLLGFLNNYIQTGYEADDLIASTVRSAEENKFMIVSADHDLYQLLSFTITQYSQVQKKIITNNSFKEKWGLEPFQWSEVKAIAGCTSDNILGIEDVGEVTAAKYLRNELNNNNKRYQSIINNEKRIEENRTLVTLPIKGTMRIKIKENNLSIKKFVAVFDKYNFKSFLFPDTFANFIAAFKLK